MLWLVVQTEGEKERQRDKYVRHCTLCVRVVVISTQISSHMMWIYTILGSEQTNLKTPAGRLAIWLLLSSRVVSPVNVLRDKRKEGGRAVGGDWGWGGISKVGDNSRCVDVLMDMMDHALK